MIKNEREKSKILGILLILMGMFIIIAWMPVWIWLVLLGIGLIYSGLFSLVIVNGGKYAKRQNKTKNNRCFSHYNTWHWVWDAIGCYYTFLDLDHYYRCLLNIFIVVFLKDKKCA
ncbi:hypothetical protein [Caloramator sp. Dgby_cultured_2]|uniref:hypothetical protein n=1 Tax=Caloramator sp. Dgby_cultured_2 TaxID=3029174 RepID=UPI00237E69DE|nr:hypothetical protein [Caloramator sp. Dgby_cultured_2]WDU84071.1 hypothetical protein PWK10_06595 [Caloramator sp. Dgby_cultured_2]